MIPKSNRFRILTIFALLAFSASVYAKNETVVSWIPAVPPSASCQANWYNRPCVFNGITIPDYPDNFPCPCSQGDSGGAWPATGPTFVDGPELDNFVDEVFISAASVNDAAWSNIVGMEFTDNTEELFVYTKGVSVLFQNILNYLLICFFSFSSFLFDYL
jgi:hypothetical protein